MRNGKNGFRTLGGIVSFVAVACMLAVCTAHGALVNYRVDGEAISVGGDTVTIANTPNTSINLTPNQATPVTALLNNVDWKITSTDNNGSYNGTLDRLMTVTLAVGSQTLSQNVIVTIRKTGNAEHQTLTIASSSPTDFSWNAGGLAYLLTVTALEFDMKFNGSQNHLPTDEFGSIDGQFLLTSTPIAPVPEPTTMIAGALLLLPLSASTLRILRRTRRVP